MEEQFQSLSFWKTILGWGGWVTIGLFLLKYWVERRKPQRIIGRHYRITSMVSVGRNVKGRIKVYLGDRVVKSLSQVELMFYNDSKSVIKDIKIRIVYNQDLVILEGGAIYMPRSPQDKVKWVLHNTHCVDLTIPYLNPFKDKRHRVHVILVCDGEVKSTEAIGQGEGWHVYYQEEAATRRKVLLKVRRYLLVGLAINALIPLVASWWTSEKKIRAFIIKDYRIFAFEIIAFCISCIFVYKAFALTQKWSKRQKGAESLHGLITRDAEEIEYTPSKAEV